MTAQVLKGEPTDREKEADDLLPLDDVDLGRLTPHQLENLTHRMLAAVKWKLSRTIHKP